MPAWVEFVREHAGLFVTASVVGTLAILVLAPVLIARLPPDYFRHEHRERVLSSARHPLAGFAIGAFKNACGAVLVLAGLVMLITPGQGVLTILAGLVLMNFPGKYALEQRLVELPRVLPALNWIRSKLGRPPLVAPGLDQRGENAP